MSEEETKPKVVQAVPVLECGHADGFEHRFAKGVINMINLAMVTGLDPVDAVMAYLQEVFAAFFLRIPTYEDIIEAQNRNNQPSSTEVH